ncbi:MAG: hypothetical protein HY517_01695 [Candidatus Aenigmarchaeota archaeon]|nr:hypothetical protein [Candidatus Aenigmarchaeota archaeon]
MSETGETLHSWVFFDIPQPDLDSQGYRVWIEFTVIPGWLVENEGMPEYAVMSTGEWNEAGGISGTFGGRYIGNCKFYKVDRQNPRTGDRRGITIADHYSEAALEKVMFLADRFESYLREQRIEFRRKHMKRTD